MSLSAARAKLVTATKALSQDWRQLDASWHDERHRDFQNLYMDRLAAIVDDALSALTELDQRVTKIRHDCE